MPDNRIEEIKVALEAATTGKWMTGVCSAKESLSRTQYHHMVTLPNSTLVIAFTGPYGEERSQKDAHLISNAPEWLRYLLQLTEQQEAEIKRKDKFVAEWISGEDKFQDFGGWERIEEMQKVLQQSREENERLRGLYEREREIAERSQGERDRWRVQSEDWAMISREQRETIERLRGELEEVKEDLKEEQQKFGALEYANIDNLNELEQVKAERKSLLHAMLQSQKDLYWGNPEEAINRAIKRHDAVLRTLPEYKKVNRSSLSQIPESDTGSLSKG